MEKSRPGSRSVPYFFISSTWRDIGHFRHYKGLLKLWMNVDVIFGRGRLSDKKHLLRF